MTEPSDPGRLANAATPSPLGRLLASAARDVPTEQELASLRERLGDVLGPAHGAPIPHGYSALAKAGIASGLAVLIAGGVLVARRGAPEVPTVTRVPSSGAARVSPPPPADPSPTGSAEGAGGASVGPASAAIAKSRVEPAKSSARTAEGPTEAALLEKARSVLGSSPAAALAATEQHTARFPHGVLSQEREVIAIEALRRLHRNAEADRRAAAFARAFPGSAHRRMVEEPTPK